MRSVRWFEVVIVAVAVGTFCSGLTFGQGSGGVDPSMLAAKEAKAPAFEAGRIEKVPSSKTDGATNSDADGSGSVAGPPGGILPDCCLPDGTCTVGVPEETCIDSFGGFSLLPGSCDSGLADCTPSDDCPGDEIPVGGSVISSTVGATLDSGIPPCGASITSPGVWYRVIGNGHNLTATTCNNGTFYDTKISVFCLDCEVPLCIGGNDDGGTGCALPSGANFESRFTWCSQAGAEYHILVHGFGGQTGAFQLDILDGGPCENPLDCTPSDDCPGDEIPVGGSVFSSTVGATADDFPLCGSDVVSTAPGVWYRVIGNGNTLVATTCNLFTLYDTQISVYCDCEEPICVGGNDDTASSNCALPSGAQVESHFEWCSEPGKEYHILVHGFAGETGVFQLDIRDEGTCETPAICEFCDLDYTAAPCENEFEDISPLGTVSVPTSECDDCGELVAIGFPFAFYDAVWTQIWISSNGFLTFLDGYVANFDNVPIPDPDSPNGLIAPLWDDWTTLGFARAVIYDTLGVAPNRRFIVQWHNVEMFNTGDFNTFQAILFEGSNCIEFRYLDFTQEIMPGDYTAGVENYAGTDGTALDTSMIESGDCFRLCPGPCLADVIIDTDLTLVPGGADLRQENEGPSITKAKFDIWNQDERRFSGTERCVSCWDQTLLSRYDAPNHFLIHNLHTDKGRARIDGVASNLCPGSIAHPLLGLAIKVITFPGRPPQIARSAVVPRGSGAEAATIKYDLVPPSDELNVETSKSQNVEIHGLNAVALEEGSSLVGDGGDSVTAGISLPGDRASITEKGSVLYFPKVELKWVCEGNTGPRGNFNGNHCRLVQDTVLSLVNDHPEPVWVQLYLVQGDSPLSEVCDISCPPAPDGSCLRECLIEREHSGWNWVDTQMELTPNQPTFWSAFTGQPAGLQPWESLDPGDPPGRPDPDANNPHQRTLRGFVIVWAVDVHGRQIRWNHLTGSTAIIHYEEASSAEYEPWAFPCLSPAAEGGPCGAVPGEINLDGIDYASAPDRLLFDFFAVGSTALSNPQGP